MNEISLCKFSFLYGKKDYLSNLNILALIFFGIAAKKEIEEFKSQ